MEIPGGKFLTFLLGTEIYGIPIRKAKEIVGMMEVTFIPKRQGDIQGVVTLRDKVIPIVDLRLKFGMATQEYLGHTYIIIIETVVSETVVSATLVSNARMLIGITVDSVSEVVNIAKNDIEPPPEYEARSEGDFLYGLGKLKGKLILILNCDKILNQEEAAYIKQELIQA